MGKELAIKDKAMEELVSLGVTGHDIGTGNVYPSAVNILQSDKQYEAFSDGGDITKKMYGKLFVRRDGNTTKDLVDQVEGTIIKIERGYEIRDEDNKILESGYGFLDAIEKDEYTQNGEKPINMVKILLALGGSKATKTAMDKLNEKLSSGQQVSNADYPFAVAVVKGSSFGNWFEAENAMQDLANEHFNRPISQIPVIAYKLVVKSKKEVGKEFTYYSMDFEVEANDVEEALEFSPFLLEAKDQHLFYKVKEKVSKEVVEEKLQDVARAQEGKVVEDEEEISEEDLPF